MDARLAEEQIFNRKNHPLLYLVKKQEDTGVEKIIQSRSGLFYVLIVAVVFLSLGLLLNIALKIQATSYGRKIIDINEMISVEKERSDRIQLKLSELKSPSRIIETAEGKMGMKISDDIRVMKVLQTGLNKEEEVYDYITRNPSNEARAYDNFIGTIYNIKDIVMVVSEGVLTFFIP
ncbi:MAG: hypothetical protein FJW66_05730 [Actinobacteria bacterium]|nr:hypothetical protein [Actinomycetota bacterium]